MAIKSNGILPSIIVPTYNEKENVKPLYQGIAQSLDDFELIFVDDNSPDGTAEVIKKLQAEDKRVKLLQREEKLGVSSALLFGSKLAKGGCIVTMDADLSHSPSELPRMLEAIDGADIVIGSRYIKGSKIRGRSSWRHVISRAGTLLARLFFRTKVKDPLSGFAIFRREVIEGVKDSLSPRGYKLLLEILVKMPQAKVKEVPAIFTDRVCGTSKLDFEKMKEFAKLCLELRRQR
jgi:dolichol-phosphate mannosyltransferase